MMFKILSKEKSNTSWFDRVDSVWVQTNNAPTSWHWTQQNPKYEPTGKKQRKKQRLGITSALCIHVCTTMYTCLVAFRIISSNILICPAEVFPLWYWWFISNPHPSLIRHFCGAILPINGYLEKALHNTLVKKEKQISKPSYFPFPYNKALHPQSMIVKNTRMILFSKYPIDPTTATLTHGMLTWHVRLPQAGCPKVHADKVAQLC